MKLMRKKKKKQLCCFIESEVKLVGAAEVELP